MGGKLKVHLATDLRWWLTHRLPLTTLPFYKSNQQPLHNWSEEINSVKCQFICIIYFCTWTWNFKHRARLWGVMKSITLLYSCQLHSTLSFYLFITQCEMKMPQNPPANQCVWLGGVVIPAALAVGSCWWLIYDFPIKLQGNAPAYVFSA